MDKYLTATVHAFASVKRLFMMIDARTKVILPYTIAWFFGLMYLPSILTPVYRERSDECGTLKFLKSMYPLSILA